MSSCLDDYMLKQICLPRFLCDMQPTVAATGKKAPRVGYVGHITRLWNKLVQLSGTSVLIKASLEVSITTKQSSVSNWFAN